MAYEETQNVKAKEILTALLLLFVVATIAALLAKGRRQEPEQPADQSSSNSSAPATVSLSDGLIAYYFHGEMRCATCQKIEEYAHEAIHTGFADQLNKGTVQWQVVNYEAPENEHFIAKYEIAAPTVVLVRIQGGKQTQWENLMRVWELVGSKEKFIAYVQTEAQVLLLGPAL